MSVNTDIFKHYSVSCPSPISVPTNVFGRFAKSVAAIVGALCIYGTSTGDALAQSAACNANETLTTFTFAANSWPAGSATQTFTAGAGAGAVTLTFTTAGPNQGAGTPRNATRGTLANSLSIEMDQVNSGQSVDTGITFSKPVDKLRYRIGDVDGSTNAWQDLLIMTGLNGATASNPTLTSVGGAAWHTIAGNQVTAVVTAAGCANNVTTCNIIVNHANPVNATSISFIAGPAIPAPVSQLIGIDQLEFCVPNVDLSLVKDDGGASFTAGTTGTYSFTVANGGGVATTAVTTVKDILPAGMSFTAPLTPGGANGALWTCVVSTTTNANDTATCTRAAGLAAGANNVFTLPVAVAANATGILTNRAKVFGGGDTNKATETTTGTIASCTTDGVSGGGAASGAGCGIEDTPIIPQNLAINKIASVVNAPSGSTFTFTVRASNSGSVATTNPTTIVDTIPVGVTIPVGGIAAGAGFTCTPSSALPLAGNGSTSLVTCVSTAGVAAGATNVTVVTLTVNKTSTSTVTNTATATTGDPACAGDGGTPPARCTGTVTVTDSSSPALSLTKTATPSPFVVGQAGSYTLTLTNTGSAATTAVATISDTIPTGLTIGTLPAGCTAAGQVVTCTVAAGLAATNGTASFVIPVTPTAAAGASVTNTATVRGGGDPGCAAATNPLPARCNPTVTTTVNAPVLTITKTASAASFVVGTAASYTLAVQNTGTAATTAAATVTDTIPTGLTIGTLPAGCTAAGQTVTCTIATGLAVNGTTSFVIPVTPTAAATSPAVNTASVTGGGDPTCPGAGHCSSTTTTPLNAPALTITKTASGASFVVGTAASYTLSVQNTGTAPTTAAATVTDTIPTGLTIGTLPAGCTAAGQVVTCTIAAGLAASATTSFVIPVTPTAAAANPVVNTANVTGGGDPGCPAAVRCGSTTTTPLNSPALSLTKTATPSPFVVGQAGSYTLTLTNTGSAATTAVATISDTIPTGLTIGTLPAGCTAAGQVVTCTVAAGLAATNGTASFVIPVTPTAAAGASVTNTATVRGGGDPGCAAATNPLPARCNPTVTTTVNAPVLTITKTASAASFVVGTAASYTLAVQNTGTAATTAAATVTDTIPTGLTIGTLPAGCTAAGQTVTCTIATGLAVNGTTSFVIPVTPTAAATSPAVNTASVTGGGDPTCPGAGHCSSTTTTPLNAPALTITKTASGASFVVGTAASYTLSVQNTGTAPTTAAATVTDTIPTGLTIGTLPAGCTAAGQVVTCTIAAGLAASATTSFVIPVTPTAAAANPVVNTANVTGGGDPGCPAAVRCGSTTTTPLNSPALSLTKTATPSPFVVGQAGSYTLTLTNTGSAATTAVATISDTIPTGLTIGTLPAGCTAAGQVVTCTVAAGLAATNGTASFVIPVTPTAAAGASVTNTATVRGGGDPGCAAATNPLPARCNPTVTTTVNAPVLTITKTASAASFVVGTAASYTLAVQNTGTAATTAAATVTDTIPTGLTIGTLPAGCTAAGQTVTCTIATGLAVNGTTSFVIPVTPTAAATSPAVNTASVTGGGDPTCPGAGHCSSTTTTPLNAPALTITKTASGASFVVGTAASYTLSVQNTGTAPTTAAATVTDTIPTGLTIGTLPAGCTAAGQVVTCTIAAGLAASATTSFVIPVTPTAAAANPVVNTANVTGGGDPGCPAAVRCGSTTTTPLNSPALSLTKTATPSPFVVGQAGSYTLTLTNTGSAATTAVATISDTIPTGLTIGTLPAGCTAAGQVVTCTVAAGLAATNGTASFVIPVTPTAAAGASVTNTATVRGGGDPGCAAATNPLPARCNPTVTTTVNAPVLTITKTASAASFVVGTAASYTLAVQNTGTAATTAAATVTDTIPTGLTIGTLPAGCTAAGQTVTCTIATGLAVNGTTSFVIPVTPTAAATSPAVNTASVTGGGDPTCPGAGHCSSTTTTPLNAPALTITKTASGASFVVGTAASYTLSVQNTGTAPTTAAATVTDTIPTGLTIGTLPAGCTAAGQVVTCTIAAGLAASATTSFVIPVTPTAAAANPVVNTANVTGGGDPGCPAAVRCGSTTTTPLNSPALSLTKTATPSPFVVGQAGSYTLTLTNTGSAATTAVATISDTIPTGLTIGTLPAGCTAAGQVVTCTVAAGLAATNGTASFVIPVTPTAAAGASVTNTATVRGGGDPGCAAATNPLPARCNPTVTTTVNAPVLTITKTASAASFVVGTAASYTLAVQNTGTAATTAAATVTDTIPTGLTIGTLPAGCTAAGQTVTCTIATGLAVNGTTSFVIPVTPTAAATSPAVNTASVTGGGDPTCPGAGHCSSTTTTPLNAPALTITKTASGASFVVGTAASYTLSVQNTGTAPTTAAATVTDTIPTGLTIGTLPAGCTAAGQVVTCTIAAGLAASATTSFVIPVTPTAAAANPVVNTANVTGGGDPGCPAAVRCGSTTTTPLNSPALSLTKTATPSPFVVGQAGSYTLTLTNTGSAATTAVATISDTIPTGLTIGTLPAGCTAAGQVVTCTVAAGLAATNGTASFVIPVTPTAAAGASVTNTATVRGGGDPGCAAATNPLPARCNPTVTTTVNAPVLTITKTASAASFVVGTAASYTLAVQNTGTAATTAAATVTDTIPTGLTIGTLPAGCTAAGQTVTCTIATGLAVNGTTSFVIPVTPTAAATSPAVNTASVTGGGDPTCPGAGHCSSTTTTPLNAPALTITKTASGASFVVGTAASYTLSVQNTGTAPTTAAATVTDTIPTGLTIGTLPAGCTAAGQVVTCTIAAGLAASATTSFVIPVTPTAAAANPVVNTANVTGGGDPGCPAAVRCGSTTTTPLNSPALSLTKTATPSPFVVGQAGSYTLTLTNTGSAATTAVATISDTIPTGLTIGTLPAGCTAAGQVVTCTVAAGLAATNGTASFVIPVTPTAAAGASVTNTATVRGGGDPGCAAATNPLPARCNPTVTTTVSAPVLTITKTASVASAASGASFTYTVQVSNSGPVASSVPTTIVDTIPTGVTLTAVTAGANFTCTPSSSLPLVGNGSTSQVTCTTAATGVAAGATNATVTTLTVTKTSTNTVLNTAQATAGDPACPAAARCTGTVTVSDASQPNVTIGKIASVANAAVGASFSFTVQASNSGSVVTTNPTTVVDTIPTGVTVTAITNGAGFTCTPSSALPLVGNGATTQVSCLSTTGVAAGAVTVTVTTLTVTKTGTNNVTNTAQATTGDPGCPAAVRCTGTSTVTDSTVPDLNPTFTFGSSAFVVGQTREFIINIRDINAKGTTGLVEFFVPQPGGVAFDDYTFDPTATNAVLLSGNPVVNNSDWTAAPDGTGLRFTLKPGVNIGAAQNFLSKVVIRATARDPGGKGAITANIASNSGGETRIDNNVVVLLTSVQR